MGCDECNTTNLFWFGIKKVLGALFLCEILLKEITAVKIEIKINYLT